jgi:hypothetical protein
MSGTRTLLVVICLLTGGLWPCISDSCQAVAVRWQLQLPAISNQQPAASCQQQKIKAS